MGLQPFSIREEFGPLDHIVIGSGVGGLTTASYLAKAGRKVLILEQHTVAGGLSHTFRRKGGFVWDVGLHYVGQMMPEGSNLRDFFDYITDHQLEWNSMGEVYDRIVMGSHEYHFPKGKENLIAYLKTQFPHDHRAIDQYFKLIGKVIGYAGLFFTEKAIPPFLSAIIGPILRRPFLKWASQTTAQVVHALTENCELRAVLCSQFGNYGLPPQEGSFGAHAIIVQHYFEGGFYPVGGSGQIAKTIVEALDKKGAMVRTHAKVSEIVVRKGRVVGVKVGERFIPCQSVISNVGAQQTFAGLLKGESLDPQIAALAPSTGHFGLYLGLDASAEELQLPTYNTWYYSDSNIDGIVKDAIAPADVPLRFAYFSCPSAKDPQWSTQLPHKATIEGIGIAQYSWFENFALQTRRQRGEAYEQLKADFERKMIERCEHLWPQIKGHIVHSEVSTPLSTKFYMNNGHGEMYGLAHTPERFKVKALRPITRIKGLYLTGQDVFTVGIAAALTSGLLTAICILKFRIAFRFREMAQLKNARRKAETLNS